MTLAELIAVSCILVMIAGTMGAMAMSVQQGGDYQYEQSVTLQHAQVTLQRLQASLCGATANEVFPGFVVVAETVSGRSYPDTVVIWRPQNSPTDPSGRPKISELIVYTPNPASPNELWEIRNPSDHRTCPAASDIAGWRTEVAALKASTGVSRVTITNRLRTATLDGTKRAVLRFAIQVRPSETEWAQYVAGTRTWESLPFVQGIRGSAKGLRQSWCRFELQMDPSGQSDERRDRAIPFFGSGAVLYELSKR